MKINITTDKRNENADFQWILRRSAEELRDNIEGVVLNENDLPSDISYFINYAYYRPREGISIAHFTHLEESDFHNFRNIFKNVMTQVEFATCTCDITRDILKDGGIEHIYKIPYGCDSRVEKKVLFGVVGSTKPTGRKGEHLVREMVKERFDVAAWGKGWACKQLHNTWGGLLDFYKSIDYLIVTATIEGGPVPVIDAINAGVPVIAPNVGWCWEYPVIRYQKGNWESLRQVLIQLTNPPTWQDWIDGHKAMFEDVIRRHDG